jgi:uncharacterized protein YndB with AHSA1/START domain
MGQSAASAFSEFKLRVNVDTPLENAYHAWATAAGLESWFCRQAVFTDENGVVRQSDATMRENDTYIMTAHGYPDTMQMKGKVLQTNGKDQLTFTFSGGCPVSISIFTEQDETLVELFESKLPAGDEASVRRYFVADSKGWIIYLTNLKSVLEGGLDLRNKKETLKNVITS